MRSLKTALVLAVIIAMSVGGAAAKKKESNTVLKNLSESGYGNRFDEFLAPDSYILESSAEDTFFNACYDFQIMDWQGWTPFDNTAQVDTYFHIDDFAGLGGGDYGRLIPIEGSRSWWCGARPEPEDVNVCSWVYPPGYGNGWDQRIVCDSIPTMGQQFYFSYNCVYDTEDDYDTLFVEYDDGGGNWTILASYEGTGSILGSHYFTPEGTYTQIRFRFISDSAYSDQDGQMNSDGAAVIDEITITRNSIIIDFEDCENDSLGSLASDGDGNDIFWRAEVGPAFGIYAGLMDGTYDPDRCNLGLQTQVAFFFGSTTPSMKYPGLYDTPACMGGGGFTAPCQNEMVVSPEIDLTKYSTLKDHVQDASIPPMELTDCNGMELQYTVVADLPLDNLVFYYWAVRGIDATGCPGEWKNMNNLYYGETSRRRRFSHDLSGYVEEDKIQVALGVVDMCDVWNGLYGNCSAHTPSPIYDNVKVYRFEVESPIWTFDWADLFQDNFPEDPYDLNSYVRADMARDTNPIYSSGIRPGDSIVVKCVAPLHGGIALDGEGEPRVFMHVRCTSLAGDDPLYGIDLEGNYGNYYNDDGMTWTVIQAEQAKRGSSLIPDYYMFDLNDSLFTRGYMIEYYFSAERASDGGITTLPPDAYERADMIYGHGDPVPIVEYPGVSYLFEFTCLPTGAADREILYVDDSHGLGSFRGKVEEHFNQSFLAVVKPEFLPDRYDVNAPASAYISNSLASRAHLNQIKGAYKVIIWDSGDIEETTISDGSGYDKSNDCYLLIEWMEWSTNNTGLWICGDNVATDLNKRSTFVSGSLLNHFCGVMWEGDSYFKARGEACPGLYPINPIGPVYNAALDGGCPDINDFDCIDLYPEPYWADTAVVDYLYATTNPSDTTYAAIHAAGTTSTGFTYKTVFYGFSFQSIWDANGNIPLARNRMMLSILGWMGNYWKSSITDSDDPVAKYSYSLSQNYPNPFNPSTTISYSVRERGPVDIKIYDVTGRLVRMVVNEVKDAGSYKAAWNGRNERGNSVASGIYFYKMKSGGFTSTKKMVLLR